MPTAREFGEGPLSRFAAFIYTLLMVEVMFLVATLPTLVLLFFLARDPSNILLAVLVALPVGPALSGTIYAMHKRQYDLTQLRPVAAFWHGYRLNAKGALAVWAPGMVWVAILAIGLVYRAAAGLGAVWGFLLIALAIVALLWTINAILITSLFAFRVRDVARLSWYVIGRLPVTAIGTVGVIAAALVLTAVTSDLVLALLVSALTLALLTVARPMLELVRAEFTK